MNATIPRSLTSFVQQILSIGCRHRVTSLSRRRTFLVFIVCIVLYAESFADFIIWSLFECMYEECARVLRLLSPQRCGPALSFEQAIHCIGKTPRTRCVPTHAHITEGPRHRGLRSAACAASASDFSLASFRACERHRLLNDASQDIEKQNAPLWAATTPSPPLSAPTSFIMQI